MRPQMRECNKLSGEGLLRRLFSQCVRGSVGRVKESSACHEHRLAGTVAYEMAYLK